MQNKILHKLERSVWVSVFRIKVISYAVEEKKSESFLWSICVLEIRPKHLLYTEVQNLSFET